MDVLRRVQRRTARVAPAPEGCSCQQPREKSSPAIPAGVEAAPGQRRRWKCLAFLLSRTPAPGAGAEGAEAASTRTLRWTSFRLGRRDPAQEGSWARRLWGCWCWKDSPQENSATGQQEASPCPLPADLPTPTEQGMGDPCPVSSTSSSACSRGDSSSSPEAPWSLDPATSPLPTETRRNQLEGEDLSPEAQEKVEDLDDEEEVIEEENEEDDDDLTMEEATRKTVMEHLQAGDMTVAEQIKFLRAIPPMCFHAQKIGRDTLEPPGSKAAVAQRIAELLEALPLDSGPSSILSSSLVAVGNLSKLQPALEQELESRLLQAGMSRIFPMDTAKDLYIQSLHKSLEEKLDMMLRGLLTTSPSTDHLQHTLEHIGFWIRSTNTTERARAMRTSTALLLIHQPPPRV
ncbi:uncharacterized protein [Emydura macquarii macquarii]|uniref:uncharacterized protein n=1 Tax=Emydura macquarii macquarii TaxID=1129001 RepID=UPI00352B8B1F